MQRADQSVVPSRRLGGRGVPVVSGFIVNAVIVVAILDSGFTCERHFHEIGQNLPCLSDQHHFLGLVHADVDRVDVDGYGACRQGEVRQTGGRHDHAGGANR